MKPSPSVIPGRGETIKSGMECGAIGDNKDNVLSAQTALQYLRDGF